MTDEKQAIKTLAESFAKAMKSVSSNAPSQMVVSTSKPTSINASKIVGLPAAFASIMSGIESSAADGDAIAQQTLTALNNIASGRFEAITADTANIEKLYATFGDFINLVAEDATIGDLDVETIKAGIADIGISNIGTATITTAQIKRASTDTSFVREEVGGKVYIDDLAVSDANIVNLAAGTVLINNSDGELVELYVDAQTGNVSTREVSYDGNDIINSNTLNGNRIVQNSITADRLNANEIFSQNATIANLISDNIDASRIKTGTLSTNLITSLSSNVSVGGKTISEIAEEKATEKVETAEQRFSAAIAAINSDIEELQSQIDGNITTWFYEIDPTLSNEPAVDWDTDEKKNAHLGDLYYNTDSSECWRWQLLNGVYSWQQVADTGVAKALADAAAAQDTADSKRRIFINTPVPPYDEGDLWVQGTNGDIYVCTTGKQSGIYVSTDWSKASKYTDDTTANTAYATATTALNVANLAIKGVDVEYAKNQSTDTPPDDDDPSWSTDAPEWEYGWYIWQRTVTTTSNSISYSDPTCISGKHGQDGRNGTNGTNGTNGINTATVNLYQRSTSTPSKPSGSLTYTFATSTLTGQLGNWSTTIPSGTDPCWVIAATAASSEATYQIASSGWSDQVKLVENGLKGDKGDDGASGKNGENGLNQATIFLYKRASSIPSKPSSNVTYTFATGALSSIPSGWSRSIPNGSQPCWVTTAVAISDKGTDEIASGEWTDVVKLVQDGSAAYVYELICNPAAIIRDNTGELNVSTVTFNATRAQGTDTPSEYAGRFSIEEYNGDSWESKYISEENESSKTYSPTSTAQLVRATLFLAGGTTTRLDVQTVPIVGNGVDGKDGKDGTNGTNGTNGKNGEDAYTVMLTNESHTFAAGVDSAIAGQASSDVIAFKGVNRVNATIGEITGYVTGITANVYNNGTTTAKFVVTVTSALQKSQGVLTIPVTVDGKEFNLYFSWALAFTGKKGDKGDKGTGIVEVVEYYARNNSTTAPDDGFFDTPVLTPTSSQRYVWNYELITYTEGDPFKTAKHIVAIYGDTGAAGKGVSQITERYLTTSTSTVPNDKTKFKSNIEIPNSENRYLWNYEIVTYTDSSYNETGIRLIGVYGERGLTGETGVGIDNIQEEYYLSTSDTTQVNGEWKSEQPVWSVGKYIWTRSKVTWTEEDPEGNLKVTYTDPVLAKAINGANTTANEAKTSVDELEIGGRNLLLKTGGEHTARFALTNTDYYIGYFAESDWGIEQTKNNTTSVFTVAFDWETTSQTGMAWLQIDGYAIVNIIYSSGNANSHKGRIDLSQGSGRYVATFKLSDAQAQRSTQRMRLRIAGSSYAVTSGATFTMRNLKFELGNRGTTWTPAPEDVDDQIQTVSSSISVLQDSVNILSTNMTRTYIQNSMPFPKSENDSWFNPATEEHYISTGVVIPEFTLGYDDDGNICKALPGANMPDNYQFQINSNGELQVMAMNDAIYPISENNVDFYIEDDIVFGSNMWRKIKNVAYSNLKVSVDGIASEVYEASTGESKIQQSASMISAIVAGDTSVPYVKSSSIEIKDDSVKIESSGNVDIKADKFSISFNTEGALENKSRVDISDKVGIRVSDKFGGYFQANYDKIGLYDYFDNPKLYLDNSGHAFFNGSLTLGGTDNTDGSLTVRNSNGDIIIQEDKNGLELYNYDGTVKQFYIDSSTGNTTFGGAVSLGGSVDGSLTVKNNSGKVIGYWDKYGIEVYDASGNTKQFYVDSDTGNATFGGAVNLGGSVDGSLTVKNNGGNVIGHWDKTGIEIYDANGNVRQFYVDTATGNTVFGGAVSLGGSVDGSLTVKNENNDIIGYWDKNGINAYNATGTKRQFYMDSSTGDIVFGGSVSLGGSEDGSLTIRNTDGNITSYWDKNGFSIYNASGSKKQFYINSKNGNATFGGAIELGGSVDGSLTVKNKYGNTVGYWDKDGIEVYDSTGSTKQFYIDSLTGDATFGGKISLGDTSNGSLTVKNANGFIIGTWDKDGISIYNSSGTNRQVYIDSSTGNATFAGNINGATITLGGNGNGSGVMTVNNSSGNKVVELNNSGITVYKGSTKQFYVNTSGNVKFAGELEAATGTFAGNLSAAGGTFNGTLSANSIVGGTLALGGTNNGAITIKDESNNTIGSWNKSGINIKSGSINILDKFILGTSGALTVKSLTANDYVYVNGNSNSYFKIPTGGQGFVSIGTEGFKSRDNFTGDYIINIGGWKPYSAGNQDRIIPTYGIQISDSEYASTAVNSLKLGMDDVVAEGYGLSIRSEGGSAGATYGAYHISLTNANDYVDYNMYTYLSHKQIISQELYATSLIIRETKNRLFSTSQYSDRLLYCYETPSPMFGDVGEGIISSDGKCYITIDPIFAQTISTDQYQVFLQRYGEGDCYVSERHGSYFVVSGTPDLAFGWELKAKQSDFDQLRLERYTKKFERPTNTYGFDAYKHIQELYEERIVQESEEK